MHFRLSVLQNHKSPILNQLVFGYAFAVRLGDDTVEEIALDRIKNEAPAIRDLECAVEIASDAGFAEETLTLVSLHLLETWQASTDGSAQVNYFLRSYNRIAVLRRNLTLQLHDEGYNGDEDDWDDTDSLSDAKCRIRMLSRWNKSAQFLSVEALRTFIDEGDSSTSGCTCGECGSMIDRMLTEYADGMEEIWDFEVK